MSRAVITENMSRAVAAIKALGIDKYHLEMVGVMVDDMAEGRCSHCGKAGAKFFEWSVRSDPNGYGNEDGEICGECRDEILAQGED